MSFSLNFTIDVDAERKIVMEKIYGTWKKETATSYDEAYRKAAEPLLGEKWAKVVNLTNWKVSYPDIIEMVGQHLRWCRQNGMVLSVNIIDNPVTTNYLKKMFSFGATEDISVIVRTPEEAQKILAEHGFIILQ